MNIKSIFNMKKDNKFDFVLKIYSGYVPYDKDYAIKINIYSRDLTRLDEYEILIKEKKYTINSSDFLNKLKTIIMNNLENLVKCSVAQTTDYIVNNSYDGGYYWNFKIKYANLIINIEGQISEIEIFCDSFTDEIIHLINQSV